MSPDIKFQASVTAPDAVLLAKSVIGFIQKNY